MMNWRSRPLSLFLPIAFLFLPLDVAYRTIDTPVGALLLAATPKGLVRATYAVGRRCDNALPDGGWCCLL
jgi:hypothetical protein